MSTTERILELLSLLQTHRYWPGAELAERLEVSDRTLRRDIERLRGLGYAIESTPGTDGGYRLATGAHLPPLLFDDEEAVALAVGLRAAAGAAVVGIEDTSLRALAKLEQVLPDRLRRRVGALHANTTVLRWGGVGPDELVDPDTLAVLAQGCRDREEVRFGYESRDGEQSDRLVQPHQLVSVGRRWYLVAWDCRRENWRTFRLDRARGARLAGARFQPRALPGGDAAEFVAGSFRSMSVAHSARVVVQARPEELTTIAGWLGAEVEDMGDGSCRLEIRSEQLGWLVAMVGDLALRFEVQVDGSQELVDLMHLVGTRLCRAGTTQARPLRSQGEPDDPHQM